MQIISFMNEYFDEQQASVDVTPGLPDSKFSEWEKVESPERLIKDYSFSNRSAALEFLRQLLLYEDSVQHHAKITIDYADVRVEVYTHDISRITELDIEYANVADQIYTDTGYACQSI